jgi:hypothetical protein
MIHYLTVQGWMELKSSGNSIRFLKEHTEADDIRGVEKLAEFLGFGFDVYVFIEPVIESKKGEKVLIYFTDKTQAETEFNRLSESI